MMVKEWMTIVQHPTGQPRQWAIRENQCIDDSNANVLWYASDTAQGSSGSPVFNDSFQIVALHHSGVAKRNAQGKYILKDGRLVASLAEADDSQIDWIANAGIRVSRICASVDATAPEKGGYIAEFNSARRGDDVLTVAYRQGNQPEAHEMDVTSNPPPAAADKLITVNKARVVIGSLVLELDAALGQGVAPAVTAVASQSYPLDSDASSSAVETFKEPIIDADYDSRHGFDANFLGVETPLPQVADPSLIAKTLAGDEIIPYEHFSLVMHRERKLAIFTAANVDGRAKAKKPEPGHKYTRKELTGLGDNDIEKWVNDPRLADEFQIPDKFYTKDRGAFDKGHITRREDVCWGNTFDDVQRANGDTFHVTNCSPQRGNFNQSGKSGIWGQLENFIGAQSGSEKYCIFAGPVLANTDKVFAGTERVQIPDRFWKVVAATTAGNLQVFAFVLEQDLTDLDLEFYVDAEWKARQVSLTELEETVALVLFPSVYHDADQA